MNNFLKYIPGFRSNKTWKKVIACIYYFITLMTLFIEKGMFLFFLAAPFFIFSIVDLFKAKKNKKPIRVTAMTLAISLVFMSVGIATTDTSDSKQVTEKEEPTVAEEVEKEEPEEIEEEPKDPEKEPFEKVRGLKIHYIDVGQGDSILVQLPNGETALIDGGPKSSSDIVVEYLKKQDVEKVDYLVATHPHEDHIGGLIPVIKSFDVGNIYMPDKSHTSKTFENLLLTIQDKGIKFKTPVTGDKLIDKEGLSFDVLAPEANASGDNLNNYSIVLKLEYKDSSFLFTGDAEIESEQTMLNGGHDLKSDVLKVGHHGSDTSTTDQFFNKVDPKYAVISCGKDNQYGHPHQTTIDKLTAKNIKIYRTDSGYTIIITSDGEKVTVEKKESPKQENAPPKEEKQKQSTEKTKKETSKDNSQSKQSSNQNVSSNGGNGAGGSGGDGSSGSSGSGGSSKSSNSSGTTASKPAPPVTDNVAEVYITNTGAKYHRAGCRYLKKSQIPISLEKAKSQGYEPCSVCH